MVHSLFDRDFLPAETQTRLIISVFATRRNEARAKEAATLHEGIALERGRLGPRRLIRSTSLTGSIKILQ
jgi:hypothetical protein